MYKQHALAVLENGGRFQLLRVSILKAAEQSITSPPDQRGEKLFVPKSNRHLTIDAWVPGIGAFVFTVGNNHDSKGCSDDQMLGTDANTIFHVLPSLHYDD